MLLKTKINLLLILLLLPISAWAIVFNPVENINFTLLGSTEFNYDSFNLNKGLTLNYIIPENKTVSIVSNGDINIYGDISVAKKAKISFFSKRGSISIFGSINADLIGLNTITGRTHTENASFFTSSSGIGPKSGLLLPSLWWSIQRPEPSYYTSSGAITTSGTITLPAIIPIPSSILLFLSAFLALFVTNKQNLVT